MWLVSLKSTRLLQAFLGVGSGGGTGGGGSQLWSLIHLDIRTFSCVVAFLGHFVLREECSFWVCMHSLVYEAGVHCIYRATKREVLERKLLVLLTAGNMLQGPFQFMFAVLLFVLGLHAVEVKFEMHIKAFQKDFLEYSCI